MSKERTVMLSRESHEQWARLDLGQRLKIVLRMIRESQADLSRGPPDVVARRFELLRRQNDERNRRMLTAIARTRTPV